MNRKLEEIFDLDRQFCELSKTMKHKGWQKYLSKDAIMGTRLHEPYIEGKGKISKIIEIVYSLSNIDFTWEPEKGFISDDETLAVTSGNYTRQYTLNNEVVEEIGKYITTWKKIDGDWKIVFDMGN